jgi:HEAT repeat protein
METISQTTSFDARPLVSSLGSNDPSERERARIDLVAMGRAAVLLLVDALKARSSVACWEAAKALGSIKDPAAANALAELLDHDDGNVRWVAAQALIALRSEGLRQTLMELLTHAGSVRVQDAARHVIYHFAHDFRGESLQPLLTKFQAYQPGVAIPPAALHALHEMERGNLRV